MSTPISAEQLVGRTAVDAEGTKIGKIGQVYLNDGTGEPEWVTVSTGMFGTKQSFAPVYGASTAGDDVRLSVFKDLVKDAPQVEDDGHLEDSETSALYQHYSGHTGSAGYDTTDTTGMTGGTYQTGGETTDHGTRGAGHDTSGPNTDDAMTRSEERLNVGTQNVESGRARLRKYIVTENVTTTVPVSHEEVRVERETITDGNVGDALSGADLSEEEHEVVLHEERPVVSKETVPVERVRMSTETVTEQRSVSEEVRKEQIEVEGGDAGRDRSL